MSIDVTRITDEYCFCKYASKFGHDIIALRRWPAFDDDE